MIEVLDTMTGPDGAVWFKVRLERNTDILAKKLFTADDMEAEGPKVIFKFLTWQNEQQLKQYEERE